MVMNTVQRKIKLNWFTNFLIKNNLNDTKLFTTFESTHFACCEYNFLPLADAADCSWKMMQPLPATVASVSAYSAAPMHGFHVRLACVPEELGSL